MWMSPNIGFLCRRLGKKEADREKELTIKIPGKLKFVFLINLYYDTVIFILLFPKIDQFLVSFSVSREALTSRLGLVSVLKNLVSLMVT
jgi:hypothetical protein